MWYFSKDWEKQCSVLIYCQKRWWVRTQVPKEDTSHHLGVAMFPSAQHRWESLWASLFCNLTQLLAKVELQKEVWWPVWWWDPGGMSQLCQCCFGFLGVILNMLWPSSPSSLLSPLPLLSLLLFFCGYMKEFYVFYCPFTLTCYCGKWYWLFCYIASRGGSKESDWELWGVEKLTVLDRTWFDH